MAFKIIRSWHWTFSIIYYCIFFLSYNWETENIKLLCRNCKVETLSISRVTRIKKYTLSWNRSIFTEIYFCWVIKARNWTILSFTAPNETIISIPSNSITTFRKPICRCNNSSTVTCWWWECYISSFLVYWSISLASFIFKMEILTILSLKQFECIVSKITSTKPLSSQVACFCG